MKNHSHHLQHRVIQRGSTARVQSSQQHGPALTVKLLRDLRPLQISDQSGGDARV